MAETFTPPTPFEVLRLADIHLTRYQNFLEAANSGQPGYRPDELRALIATWKTVVAAQGEWARLSQAARSEVMDAVGDEPVGMETGIEMPTRLTEIAPRGVNIAHWEEHIFEPKIRPLADYLTPVPDEDEPPARSFGDADYRDRVSVAMSDDDAARVSLARVAPFEDEYDVPRF